MTPSSGGAGSAGVVAVALEADVRDAIARALSFLSPPPRVVATTEEGRAGWAADEGRVLFIHVSGAEDEPAWALIDLAREREGATVVAVAGPAGPELSRQLIARSGVHLLHLPLDPERVRWLVEADLPSPSSADEEAVEESRILESLGWLFGRSEAMQALFRKLIRAAPAHATVLVTGESGTGKELVGRTLHALSERAKGPYVAVNCGAISPTLMESELFGHEKGSFTGAMRQHRGFFERADRGTLFLDEITEMAPELQVKLLRVLETSQFTRIGGEIARSADVRIAAATNRRPEEAVADGKLREDLLYRLKVIHLDIPPLRERREDIDLIAPRIVEEVAEREGVGRILPADTLRTLKSYDWPGNVRELQNALYTAYLLSEGDEVEARQLPGAVRSRDPAASGEATVPIRVGSSIRDAERTMILTTLARMEGNKTRTAEALGISLKTLYNRLHTYGYMGKEEGEDDEGPGG